MRLAAVIDSSKAYVSFQKERVLASWNVAKDEVKLISTFVAQTTSTLFGEELTPLLDISDEKLLSATGEGLKALTPESFQRDFPQGLLITTTLPRTKTKKLEAAVKALGGSLMVPPGKGDGSLSEKLLSELALTPAVRSFVLSYVGEDYDILLPLITSLSAIPQEHHKKVTEEDIVIRFPQPPGSVPYWNVEKFLMEGKLETAIDHLRRISKQGKLLLALFSVKNKVLLSWKLASLLAASPSLTDSELAEALSLQVNYPFKLAKASAKKHGLAKCQRAADVVLACERNIKGRSAASSLITFEVALVELHEIFTERR